MATSSNGEIRSLNTVRGVAALMIALFHAPAAFGVTTVLPHAYVGVDLFFVLSGFVISLAYGPRVDAGMTFGRFAQLRMARLYPLLFLATLAGFGVWILRLALKHEVLSPDSLLALPLNLALLPTTLKVNANGAAFPYVVQAWSISWEIVMYLGFFIWRRQGGQGAWRIAALGGLAMVAIAATQGRLDGGWTAETFFVGGARAMFGFWAGVAIGRYRKAANGPSLPPLMDRALMVAGGVAAGLLVFYVAFVPQFIWWAEALGPLVAIPLILSALILRPQRWLESWIGDRLGDASYSLYLLHGLTLDVLAGALSRLPALSPFQHFVLGLGWLAGIVVVSWFVWRWVETPLRIYFSRDLFFMRHLDHPDRRPVDSPSRA
jgi:peptidoglycan/LPS O-acetylase OafA/YrhL